MEKVTLSDNVTEVLSCAYCYNRQSFTFQDLSENRKILKMQKESEFVRIRAPAAILPAESAICKLHAKQCR
jgi:hypothetical protein